MAIFGDLKDIGILDIFPIVASQNGRFEIEDGNRRLIFYLRGGRLVCAYENDAPLGPTGVEEAFLNLARNGRGRFRFELNASPANCNAALNLPADELLLRVATLKDEIEYVEDALPHPRATFILVNPEKAKGEPELYLFLQHAWPYLAEGTSAEHLSRELKMAQDRVRYLLYKARLLGAIRLKTRERKAKEAPGLVRRVLSFFQRRSRQASL
jgi:hypothetical protein